ncbi:MAG: TPM domain-containing protein [Bacteroidetes bacterium]|nr:TPM domain-containing protein [Bacteroidota bacterium]
MFPFSRKNKQGYLSKEEEEQIVHAIKTAEVKTSGEVRVYVEGKCRFVDAIDRAAEIFYNLHMNETQHKNATLIYVAMKHKQVAVFGDEGILKKTGAEFWHENVKNMLQHFHKENYVTGICEVIEKLGLALAMHFPYEKDTDKNELPDEIVFGK